MGSELVSDLPPQGDRKSPIPLSFHNAVATHLPFYLNLGVTPDEFWNGDSENLKAYRKAYEMRKEEENQRLWLQGMYIYDALLRASPALRNNLSGHRIEPQPYRDAPFPIYEKPKPKLPPKEQMLKQKSFVEAWAIGVNKKMKEVKNDGCEPRTD